MNMLKLNVGFGVAFAIPQIKNADVTAEGVFMKKFLSMMLALAMIISCVTVFSLTANAADGDWDVYASRGDYQDKYSPDNRSVPGYEYTDEGLHMIPADYTDFTPNAMFQTKDLIDIRQGVYLKVRIDNFTHGGDEWFGFFVQTYKNDWFIDDETYGNLGLGALVRPNPNTKKIDRIQSNYSVNHDEDSKSTSTPGIYTTSEFDEQGRIILTYEITYSEEEGYKAFANGAELDAGMMQELGKLFDENNGMMYIGFQLQNSNKGGTVECTILEFGTNAEDAEVPMGDDSADPINRTKTVAPLEDASKIPLGEPAIRLTGDAEDSDTLMRITSTAKYTVNDDFTVRLRTTNPRVQINASVKYETSYSVNDFPYAMMIVRNLCSCDYQDIDYDGEVDKICTCSESGKVYVMVGDVIQANENYTIATTVANTTPATDEEGNTYMYFLIDLTSFMGQVGADGEPSSRINALRVDIHNVKSTDPDRNSFDFCEIAFLRSEEEVAQYFKDYMEMLGGKVEDTEDSTDEQPSETPTEDPDDSGDDTNAPTEDTNKGEDDTDAPTDTPDNGNDETEAPTNAPANNGGDEKEPDASEKKSGCGGTVGVGAVAVMIIACIGFVSFRKKED